MNVDAQALARLKEGCLYNLLGVTETSSQMEIKKAYRVKVKELHPDKHNNSEEKTKEFQKIQNAYEILSDEETKEQYDIEQAAQKAELILLLKQDLFRMLANAFTPSK